MKACSQEKREKLSKIHLSKQYGNNKLITGKMSGTRFFNCYQNLYRRCNSIKNNRYQYYGGRGIKCEWQSFKEFVNDMLPSYIDHCKKYGVDNTQIDRINNDGNYSKENCRWATRIEQIRNQKGTILVDYHGKKISLREWSLKNNLSYKSVFYQYRYKNKSTIEIYKHFKK